MLDREVATLLANVGIKRITPENRLTLFNCWIEYGFIERSEFESFISVYGYYKVTASGMVRCIPSVLIERNNDEYLREKFAKEGLM